MRWFINRQGETKGPCAHAEVLELLRRRKLEPTDLVCLEGTENWQPANSVPELALPSAKGDRQVAVRPVWPLRLAIASMVLGAAFAGLVGWLFWDMRVRSIAATVELKNSNRISADALRELQILTAPPLWQNERDVVNSCFTNNSEVTCTFTNRDPRPVTTCVQGLLSPKEANGVRLQSLPICSGKLMPAETRTVAAPWVGGMAGDVCYTENYYGKRLDWSKCKFSTGPFDLSASVGEAEEKARREYERVMRDAEKEEEEEAIKKAMEKIQ